MNRETSFSISDHIEQNIVARYTWIELLRAQDQDEQVEYSTQIIEESHPAIMSEYHQATEYSHIAP